MGISDHSTAYTYIPGGMYVHTQQYTYPVVYHSTTHAYLLSGMYTDTRAGGAYGKLSGSRGPAWIRNSSRQLFERVAEGQ